MSPLEGDLKLQCALAYVRFSWRGHVGPLTKKAYDTTDPTERAELARKAHGYLVGLAASINEGLEAGPRGTT